MPFSEHFHQSVETSQGEQANREGGSIRRTLFDDIDSVPRGHRQIVGFLRGVSIDL